MKKTVQSYQEKTTPNPSRKVAGAFSNQVGTGLATINHQRAGSVLSDSPEQEALCFLLAHFLPHVPGYFTDELPNVYANAGASSILSHATVATSLGYTSLHPLRAQFRPLALLKYTETLQLVSQSLRDPQIAQSDEFLMSLLMLGMFEVSTIRFTIEKISS